MIILLAGGLVLAHLTSNANAWLGALLTVLLDGLAVAAIVTAAGGFGYVAVRRLAPASAPSGLRVVTACGLGMWMLSTAVLAVGSATTGLLKPWLWWPVIGVGILLAAWQGRKKMEDWTPPKKTDGRGLMWVLLALAAGIWLAGATLPPGFLFNTADPYDVLEYHLQVPREFHHAQHVGELRHNVYSYYPLGLEMLFLLAMSLRAGAYEGMYLAKLLHGAFGVMTVAGIFLSLKRDDEARGRFGAALLGTTPILLYLSWIAMVELSQVFYLAMALLWLREWLKGDSARSAVCLGVMLGASCAMKYLSVGLIVAPVVVVMIAACVRSRKRVAHLPAAALATMVLFSPWLIRNTVYTGNPVFPLATSVLGRGHWSEESQARWLAGHGPEKKPPVPPPPGYKPAPSPSRLEMFFENFIAKDKLGHMVLLLAALAICAIMAERGPPDAWDSSLVGVLAAQLGVWTVFTHGMPTRFIVVATVPICLLAGGFLSRLARVKANPLKRGSAPPPGGPWGLAPAVVIFTLATAVNLITAYNLYGFHVPMQWRRQGTPGNSIATQYLFWNFAWDLPKGSRVMLVGDAKGFYFPPGTIYATAFDAHPLAELIDSGKPPLQIVRDLRARGVTHVWVDWSEIVRLANTYGYPAALTSDLLDRAKAGGPVGTAAFDRLGLKVLKHFDAPQPTTAPTTSPATAPATAPVAAPADQRARWPILTIYTLPED